MTLGKAGLTGFFLFCMAPVPSLAETAAQLSKALDTQASATAVLQSYCHRLYPGMAVTAISSPPAISLLLMMPLLWLRAKRSVYDM
ncbi:hypothetical protein [Asaia prunellae]|uniref:hypothetical protein n=1 Tax=Asaia prunellae TaxID=610245 RepID=UPI0006881A1D|nr:hypothetical protein [Asaia prunellae]